MPPKKKAGKKPPEPTISLKLVEIEKLRFDITNPRVAGLLPPKPTQPQIAQILIELMDARDLVRSFMVNGFLPYEPLIIKTTDVDGVFVVLEGNRRLAALRAMASSDDPEEAAAFKKHGLHEVPAILFNGEAKTELAYLGLRHLSKTKDWKTEAKAAFVERILSVGMDLKEAAQITNTTPNALRQLLLVRRLFERAKGLGLNLPPPSTEGDTLFWHLGDAVRRTKTREYLKLEQNPDPLKQPVLDENRFQRLVVWIYGDPQTKQEPLIKSIRDIPSLDSALSHSASIASLEEGSSLAEALEEAEAAGVRVASHLDRAKRSIQRATKALANLDDAAKVEIDTALAALTKAVSIFTAAMKSASEV